MYVNTGYRRIDERKQPLPYYYQASFSNEKLMFPSFRSSSGHLRKLSFSWLQGGLRKMAGADSAERNAEGRSDGEHYKVAVVGAGPAGVAVLSALLDLGKSSILWIDPHFNSGRLSTYTEVPSNTKVKLFQQFVTTSPSLNRYAGQALAQYGEQDPERGCSLSLAVRMIKTLTDCIRQNDGDRVRCSEHFVKELRFLDDGKWHLDTGDVADQVYLVTGSAPSKYDVEGSGGPREIELDVALTPSLLRGAVQESDSVGVVGSSHSAMLALRNLVNCEVRPKKIVNFYRSPLLYAQFMDNWILYDNTGLKGEVAEWTKKEVESGKLEKDGVVTRVCVKDRTLEEQRELWKGECTKLVQAVGFRRNALPRIVVEGKEVMNVEYDPLNGKIADGLFGYGIAFPERTTDPHGNREFAVGLWKFMRYARETVAKHALQLS